MANFKGLKSRTETVTELHCNSVTEIHIKKPSKYLETDQQTSKLIEKKKKENTMEI